MNVKKYNSMLLSIVTLFAAMFVMSVAVSDEMTPSSMVFDDKIYTAEVEKGHQKLHILYGEAFDKSLTLGKRVKARMDFFDVSQDLNKKMHSHVMSLNIKEGAALSPTYILLSTHLLLMTADMLTTMQQETWMNDPSGLVSR